MTGRESLWASRYWRVICTDHPERMGSLRFTVRARTRWGARLAADAGHYHRNGWTITVEPWTP